MPRPVESRHKHSEIAGTAVYPEGGKSVLASHRHKHSEIAGTAVIGFARGRCKGQAATSTLKSRGLRFAETSPVITLTPRRHKHSEIAGTAVLALRWTCGEVASATSTLKSRGLRCVLCGGDHAGAEPPQAL